MKYWTIVFAALNKKRWRTFLTLMSITVAFLLFGLLRSVAVAFTDDINFSGDDRLVVASKYSIIDSIPIGYMQRIQTIEEVEIVAHTDWFGGTYKDRRNFFPKWPVPAKEFLDIYTEYKMPEDQRNAFIGNRAGLIAGKRLAEKFNWKIGDKIPIIGDIYYKKDGTNLWEFDLVGIFSEPENRAEEDQVFINYAYFGEAKSRDVGKVGNFVVKLRDKNDGEKVANQIDAMFSNSVDETKTRTEEADNKMFASQVGDIGLIMNSILAAVFFTILLVTGNTMSQAIRERTSEIAVLKAIGYRDMTIMVLVLFEAIAMCVLGAILGLILIAVLIPSIQVGLYAFFGDFGFKPSIIFTGLGLALCTALLSGFPPAVAAMRLNVVDALRKE